MNRELRSPFHLLILCLCLVLCASSTVQAQTSNASLPGLKAEQKHTTMDALSALDSGALAKIDPLVIREILGDAVPARTATKSYTHEAGKTTFKIYLKEQTDMRAAVRGVATAHERRVAVNNALRATARRTQGGIAAALATRKFRGNVREYMPFHIFNGFIAQGDAETLAELAKRPDVERIVAIKAYSLIPSEPTNDTVIRETAAEVQLAMHAQTANESVALGGIGGMDPQNWNIDLVDADRVWNELGINGSGVTLASIDTGVRYTHAALVNSYRGNMGGGVFNHNYNWFDADGNLYPNGDLGPSRTSSPADSLGHGTHTMGTMVGNGGTTTTHIGMAPGAKWISCSANGLGASGNITDDIIFHKSFQWMLAPTDLTGSLATADPSKAPCVVSNSWGSGNGADITFKDDLIALRAAGIMPVFASGNPSAGVGSVGSPGALPEAFTVGATNSSDVLASFSGYGPTLWETIKPEVTAPGVSVYSSYSNGYISFDGTSMAAPHVAGLVALMKSANASLSLNDIEQFIEFSAVDLGVAGPDNMYGYGRIRAFEAVRLAQSAGWLYGTVTQTGTGTPIANALIQLGSNPTYAVQTDSSGAYSLAAPAGNYAATVSAYSYLTSTTANISISTGVSILINYSLDPQTLYSISGSLYDAKSHSLLQGAIYVVDQPSSVSSYTTGAYSLSLPAGTWTLEAITPGYRKIQKTVTVSGAQSGVDFALPPAPRILLVEADRFWGFYYGYPAAEYYKWALDYNGYQYDYLAITTNTLVPTSTTMLSYDVVIWAHTYGSPGYIKHLWGSLPQGDAVASLQSFLGAGGRLIISGQDIGYWDVGNGYASSFIQNTLSAVYKGNASAASGATGASFLASLACEFQTSYTQKKVPNTARLFYPDMIRPQNGAFTVLSYNNGIESAAIAVSNLVANSKHVYISCGFESLGPRPTNAEVLRRCIEFVADSTAPTVTIAAGPTPAGPVNALTSVQFTVVFSEDVTSFTAGNVTLNKTRTANATVGVTGGPSTYTVTLTNATGNGTLGITIPPNVAQDAGLNWNGSAPSATFTVDNTSPTLNGPITLTDATPTSANTVRFSVKFSESVGTTFDASDVTVNGTLAAGAIVNVTGGLQDYTVSVTPSNPNADGTIGITIGTAIADLAGNTFAGGSPSSMYTIDNTPVVSGITPTSNTTPTWNWASGGGGGNGTFRYQLDSQAGAWTQTTALSWTPGSPLSETTHTLYVQECDAADNWSGSGSCAVRIDTTAPVFVSLAASPSTAGVGVSVSITFTASEALAANPVLTVNTHAVTYQNKNGATYTYQYIVQASDPHGHATIVVSGFDLAGNAGQLTDTVALDVDNPLIEIVVSPSAWVIGSRSLNAVVESGAFVTTNTGNVAEDFRIWGTDGASSWTLQSAAGVNAFRVEVDQDKNGSYDFNLTKSEQPLASNVAVGGSQTLGLRYSAPTSDTLGAALPQDFVTIIKASRHVP